jgi:hypothetical protein
MQLCIRHSTKRWARPRAEGQGDWRRFFEKEEGDDINKVLGDNGEAGAQAEAKKQE